jgi:anti-anti-sigma factor
VGIFDVVSARLADGEVFDSAKLKNTVRFLIENDMRNVVIDLGNLEYLYSDTINAFIASNRHMLEVSGRIAILTEHPKVQDILKRAGLDNIMRIYRSEAEMIADSKEILRQTSSYRIEELQKISTQPPEHPQIPRTEFEDFKAEMGQRLSTKLDNNELPQYQMGVPPNPATPYPTFNAPSFTPTQVPEAPPSGYPKNPITPGYNAYPNQTLGMPNPPPAYPPQTPQNYNQAPPNFDFPTVQLPVGQFGTSTPQKPPEPTAQPGTIPGYGNGKESIDGDPNDPRNRKSSQERMRSPNARRQQGRRVGGRDGSDENEEAQGPESLSNSPDVTFGDKPVTSNQRESEKYSPFNMPPNKPTSLVEEARFPAKLMVVLLLIGIGVGLYFFLSSQGSKPDSKPATTTSAEPNQPPAQAVDTMALPAGVEPGATSPATPTGQPSQPIASTPEAKAPTATKLTPVGPPAVTPLVPAPKPTPEPTAAQPKTRLPKKPGKIEKVEPSPKPAPEAKVVQQPEKAPVQKGLYITSEPSGAEVLVNFSKKGTTPLRIDLTNNSNKIIVRLPGYKRFEITLPKNHPEHELEISLDQEGQPQEEQKPVAKPMPKPEPKPITKVEPKPEPVVEPKSKPVPEPADYEEPEDLPIAKPRPDKVERPNPPAISKSTPSIPVGDGPIGIIFLSSSPARADIIIDGKDTGKKTPTKVELPSGNHRIEMSKGGQKAVVNQIVNEGKNKAVHLTLQ